MLVRFVSILILFNLYVKADSTLLGQRLSSNMRVVYANEPKEVKDFWEIFSQGEFYGRLRFNSFFFDWEKTTNQRKDHYTLGVGGSMLFKSAYWQGFGMGVGVYTSQNPIHMSAEDVGFYKAGKGVLCRYDVKSERRYGMTVLAQEYFTYQKWQSSLKVGRFLFETLFTKSNDTKMIPNAFEGISLQSNLLYNTTIKAAYLVRQKLRDHSHFHHLLAYDGWRENDDSSMHKGITLAKLKEKGLKDRLWVIEVASKREHAFQWLCNFTNSSDLLSLLAFEGGYGFRLQNGYRLKPSFRYIHQFDEGAGEIGGANLKGNRVGYRDPDSLQSALYLAKIDLSDTLWRVRLAYSKVADQADFVTPWRGFPTGGFTRLMGQYNWYANTKTYMLEGMYDFGQSIVLADIKAKIGYALQDFDDKKPGVQSDSRVLTLDLFGQSAKIENLYTKLRLAYVDGKENTVALDGEPKSDPSYREVRFEVNYLF